MEDKKEYTKEEVGLLLNNTVLYMSIDYAISDAIFAQSHIAKDEAMFIKPLRDAREICARVLVPNIVKQPIVNKEHLNESKEEYDHEDPK